MNRLDNRDEESVTQEDMTAGSRTAQEVASQPACWRHAARLAADVAGSLPAPGERVAVAGCGTSWFMAQSYAAAREQAGHGETDAFAASEMPAGRRYDRVLVLSRSGTTTEIVQLLGRLAGTVPTVAITAAAQFMAQSYAAAREQAGHGETDAFAASEMPAGRRYNRVLVLSRSGTTTEIVQLLGRLRGTVPTVAITAATWGPVAQAADEVIDLGFADEESVVQTRFATTELVLLRAHLGHDPRPGGRRGRAGAGRAAAARDADRRTSSPSSAPAGPTGWPTRPR